MLGIIIGVSSVISIVTVGNGGRDYIVGMIREMGNSAISLTVNTKTASDDDYFTDADVNAIKKPFISFAVIWHITIVCIDAY